MLVWFVIVSVTAVALIFRSSGLDYRLVVVGSLLPLAEGVLGRSHLMHTLMFSVALLFGVMILARGRRLAQRRWLALPIGTLCHLVLDGTWMNTGIFWWPFAGVNLFGSESVSEFDRVPEVLFLDLVGLLIGFWSWRRFGLSDRSKRKDLWSKGYLSVARRP